MAGWDDVPHLSEKAKAELLASTPPHLRDARSKGIPAMGSGRIFTTDENALKVAPFPIPAYWPRLAALDFGWNHPTAAVWLAFDMDTDTIYVTDTHREAEMTVPLHASAIRRRGAWIPCAWPHDGLQHDKHAGEQLAEQYRQEGVNMLAEMARYPEGHKVNGTSIASRTSVEAGIWDMQTRMEQGRLKVFANQDKWFEEYRLYYREDGVIVKLFDDLLSATRYGVMMKRFAIVEPQPKRLRDDKARRSANSWKV